MNPLANVPARIRVILYWIGYFLGVVGSSITSVTAIVAASSPTFSMPLWLVVAQAVLTIIVSQLNLLAGSNVTSEDVYADEIREWSEAVERQQDGPPQPPVEPFH